MHDEFSLTDLNLWPSFLLNYVVHPAIMIILCLLSVFVVLGNIIVVTAIWHENQLHSVTNYLIASLAAADCLVGLLVMPFCIISEIIIGSWTFGEFSCHLYHSFDVLASTASIMNLCAISLDRYLAITNPISYPTKMTPRRVALLIVSLWTCSSLISFPAILWWQAVGQSPLQQISPFISTTATDYIQQTRQHPQEILEPLSATEKTTTMISNRINQSSSPLEPRLDTHKNLNTTDKILYRCVFTDDPYYLMFSSFISFYGPLCVMLYAYYRIYKAAVQQTRFLKYGSKQVMIGRSGKKNKRHRYLSEHSNLATSERFGLSELNCDGVSNIESYDRQHLVLRAHRGGGGGGGAATSSASNNTNGTMTKNSACETSYKYDQKKKENNSPTCEIATTKSTNSNKIQQMIDHGGHKSASDKLEPENNQGRSGKNSYRINRINSALDKRDKMRMDSQRFDLKPPSRFETHDYSSYVKVLDTREELTKPSRFDSSKPTSDSIQNSRNIEEQQCRVGYLVKNNPRHKTRPAGKAKASMATINRNSNTVDMSVIDQGIQNRPVTGSISSRSIPLNSKRKPKLIDARTTDPFASAKITDKRGLFLSRDGLYCDREGPDEQYCTSDSTAGSSSGSYGTGSVSSVLVRPQCSPDADHEHKTDQSVCDTVGGQYRMRRALSVDNVEPSWPGRKPEPATNTRDRPIIVTTTGTGPAISAIGPGKNSTISLPKIRHRASCGYPLGYNRVSELKNAKTLDIRSWVKMARARTKRSHDSATDNSIRPPASLVPLMMMNSDTSTDSSIVTVETRKFGAIREIKAERYDDAEDSTSKVNFNLDDELYPHCQLESGENKKATDFKKTVSLELSCEREKKKVDPARYTNIANDTERGKGQLLYYDSDKLIQSIVDLQAMHYIDCTNQNSQYESHIGKSKVNESLTNASDISNDAELVNSNLVDQSLIIKTKETQNSVPRQKSVGKKLTKLAKERKAAKTLGIVVGVFILCWLPFFVVNIIVAVCGINCIYKPQILLSIVTWLGWINSAMNPVIYACWSRDFRRAFRRVLCTWVEFLCLYDGSKLAKKLRLKNGSNYSNAQEAHLNRTASSIKGLHQSASVAIRGGTSTELESARSNHRSHVR